MSAALDILAGLKTDLDLLQLAVKAEDPYSELRIRVADIRAATQALAAALSTEPGEAEGWRGMDSAPKDGTVVNVVGRYLDATAGFPRYAAFNEGEWVEYSRAAPVPLTVWAWRPRDAWPQEPAAPLPEDTHHGR